MKTSVKVDDRVEDRVVDREYVMNNPGVYKIADSCTGYAVSLHDGTLLFVNESSVQRLGLCWKSFRLTPPHLSIILTLQN